MRARRGGMWSWRQCKLRAKDATAGLQVCSRGHSGICYYCIVTQHFSCSWEEPTYKESQGKIKKMVPFQTIEICKITKQDGRVSLQGFFKVKITVAWSLDWPPDDIIHWIQAQAKSLQLLLFRVIECPAASIHFVYEQTLKWRWLRHKGGHQANNMLAGKDLRSGKDMGIDEGLINSQECLIPTCTNPSCLASIFGTNVGHGRWLGIPVGHI